MPTVLYQGHDIVITDDVFAVWGPEPQVYDLEALEDVRIVHHESGPTRFVPLLAVGVLGAAGAATGWLLVDTPGAYVVAAAVVVVPPVAGRALRIFTPVVWALKAAYSGADVTLFASTNLITVARVKKGLFRAFEASARNIDRLDRAGYAEAFRRLDQSL